MEKLIFSIVDEKGREFKLIGNLDELKEKTANLMAMSNDEAEEEGYVYCGGGDDRPSTEDDRFEDAVGMAALFAEDNDWTEVINNLPKKKNGTFAKSRVKVLHRARSFSQKWEDSYGYGAPEIRIKVRGDLEAYVEFGWFVEQW